MKPKPIDIRNSAEVAINALVEEAMDAIQTLERSKHTKEAKKLWRAAVRVREMTKDGKFMPEVWGQALFQHLQDTYGINLTKKDMDRILVLAFERVLKSSPDQSPQTD